MQVTPPNEKLAEYPAGKDLAKHALPRTAEMGKPVSLGIQYKGGTGHTIERGSMSTVSVT